MVNAFFIISIDCDGHVMGLFTHTPVIIIINVNYGEDCFAFVDINIVYQLLLRKLILLCCVSRSFSDDCHV